MNLGTSALALLLEAWAAETLGINTYEHQPTVLSEALPLVICEIQTDRAAPREDQLEGFGAFEQTYIRARVAQLMLMVTPEPSWTATQSLYGYVDNLAESIGKDPTLGGRVPKTSRFFEASYTPPEVQHADGTVARAATFQMLVGETKGA